MNQTMELDDGAGRWTMDHGRLTIDKIKEFRIQKR